MKTDFKQLDALIDHLRSKGVVSYKADDVELVLLADEPQKPEPKVKKTVEEILEGGVKKGADGLTAQAQEDLYGVVIDAGT